MTQAIPGGRMPPAERRKGARRAQDEAAAGPDPTFAELVEPPPGARWKRRVGWVVAWLVLTGLVILSLTTVEWGRVWTELRHIRLPWLLLAIAGNVLIVVCWTALWKVFIPDDVHVTFGTMFSINSITAAVMNTTPLLVGHASGVAMLVRRAGLTSTSALGVIALDQLAEGIAKVLTFLLAALLLPLPDWMRHGVIAVAVGVGAMLAILLVFAHTHKPIETEADRPEVAEWQGLDWRRRAWRFTQRWARDLEALRDWRKAGMSLVFAIAMKGSEALGIYAVQRALGVHLPITTVPVVLAAVQLATMIPLSPGNLGPYEAATLFTYRFLGLPTEQALSVALIQHMAFLLPMLGVGYAMMSLGSGRARRNHDRVAVTPSRGSDMGAR